MLRAKAKVARWIERLIYRSADRFWVTCRGAYEQYAELFGDDSKLDLVYNGYDFDPTELDMEGDGAETVRIVCLGKFAEYGTEKARWALDKLQTAALSVESISLEFIGTGPQTRDLVHEAGLEDIATFHPRMPYMEGIQLAARADMGLCLFRDEQSQMVAKAFDYIGLGLTIYDVFEEDSNARQFLAPFLSERLAKKGSTIDWVDRERYSRLSRMQEHLHKIDEKAS